MAHLGFDDIYFLISYLLFFPVKETKAVNQENQCFKFHNKLIQFEKKRTPLSLPFVQFSHC